MIHEEEREPGGEGAKKSHNRPWRESARKATRLSILLSTHCSKFHCDTAAQMLRRALECQEVGLSWPSFHESWHVLRTWASSSSAYSFPDPSVAESYDLDSRVVYGKIPTLLNMDVHCVHREIWAWPCPTIPVSCTVGAWPVYWFTKVPNQIWLIWLLY